MFRLLAVLLPCLFLPSLALGQVSCGDTVTEKVTLEADLLNCPGDGLVVGADKVTIDLNGFMIEGQGAGAGIKALGFDSVTVKDGTIADFSQGVSADGQKLKLTDLTVFGCTGDGIDLNDSDLAKLKGVFANGNGQDGISINLGGTGNKIEKSAAVGNGDIGVAVNGTGNTIKKVDAAVNMDGIVLNGTGNTVDGCTAHRNTNTGVTVSADDNVVKKTEVWGNIGQGVLLIGANDVTVEKVDARGNRQSGIFVASDSDRAVVKKNESIGNQWDGVEVDPASDDAVIDGNEALANGRDGIRTTNASSLVKKNEANRNAEHGIRATGAIDGGGNEAEGNVDSPECLGVVCK